MLNLSHKLPVTVHGEWPATAKANRQYRVLVVDDDPAVCGMVVDYLRQHDVQASAAATSQDCIGALSKGETNLIVLETQLAGGGGFDLLRRIRAQAEVPVIIATRRSDDTDKVIGLEFGADDYLTKPFSLRELLARMRAVMRRYDRRRKQRSSGPERGGYRFQGWRLRRRDRSLTDPGGQAVPLTRGEYGLLVAFLGSPQCPLSREQLLQATRVHEDVFDRSIDINVLRLRRKLEADPGNPRLIITQRGVGYVFTAEVEEF